MSLLSDNTRRTPLYDHYLQHSHVHVYEATNVFFGKERLIPLQGKDSNSFLHRTLTKSSNKSMLIYQAYQTTLWCVGTLSTSFFYLYIKEWRLEKWRKDSTIHKCQNSVKFTTHQILRISYKLSYLKHS
jgi:hypothetical protein